MDSENITKVLYPNDEMVRGKRLRLEQQYFFVSCSLQDMIRIYRQRGGDDLSRFHEKYAVQLNDTHPAVAVAELMRLLVDVHGMGWDEAWEITRRTFAYTNHTLLPEALEKWQVEMFGAVLPRHLEIVYEINRRFLDEVRHRYPGEGDRAARLSLIDESGGRSVRMAHLASVGSHRINGVAALHTELLKADVLRDFHELWPEKFVNVTNGVTPRRFLALANPRLAALVTEAIGDGWPKDLERLRRLEPLAEDAAFREKWRAVKRANKADLAAVVEARAGVACDPDSLFDVQVKRIHEYKRQHLNVLHVVALWQRLRREPMAAVPARTVLFGGKAAPGYRMAKLIIKLVHSVAEVVNADPATRDRLRVAFLPDYNVKNCMPIFPAAELSEQISTAGKEASGTGNMKFAMNGALTIGTLDGANVEIREAVGPENFFLFGLTVDEIRRLRAGGYRARDLYESDSVLRGGGRRARRRHLLARRPVALPSHRGLAARRRPLARRRGLPLVPRVPGGGGPRLPRPRALDPDVDPERRADGLLLVRPIDRRLLPRRLAGAAGPDRPGRPSASIMGLAPTPGNPAQPKERHA